MSLSSGRIYAIQYSDGIVKFGLSTSYKSRWAALNRKGGVRQISFIASPPIDDLYRMAEKRMLGIAASFLMPAKGREYFHCSDFGVAINIVKQAHKKFATVETGWRYYKNTSPIRRWAEGFLNNRISTESVHIYSDSSTTVTISSKRGLGKVTIPASLLYEWVDSIFQQPNTGYFSTTQGAY